MYDELTRRLEPDERRRYIQFYVSDEIGERNAEIAQEEEMLERTNTPTIDDIIDSEEE